MTMRCNEFQSLASRLECGELDPAVQAAGERHARECPACLALLRELREAAEATRRAAADDARTVEPALDGFEDRVMTRLWRERRAAALSMDTGGRGKRSGWSGGWRLVFGLSLAFNVCAAVFFGVVFLGQDLRKDWQNRWSPRRPLALPAGMPAPAQMSRIYGELEALFGERLNWVSECGGKIAMDVIHDPADVPANAGAEGPLVALVYWLDTADGAGTPRRSDPVVILTRPGRAIRERIPLAGAQAPVEIAVDSFTRRRGAFAIETEVRPVAAEPGAGRKVTSLAAAVDLHPGEPTKLGEVRLGDRMYDTFLAVQTLKEAGGDDRAS